MAVAAWFLMLLLLAPGVAEGQAPVVPASPAVQAQIVIDPHTPPPPTIQSAPEIVIPAPPPVTMRPVKTFDIRPTLGVSEEYSDNFDQSPDNKVSNFRSRVTPGLLALFDAVFLTGRASYSPSVFYDSSAEDTGVRHSFAGQLAWQATPRLTLAASEAFTQSDEPERADRLNLRRGREEFTSNLLSLTGDYLFEPYATQAYYRLSTFSGDDSTTTHTAGASGSVVLARIHTLRIGYEYLNSDTTVETTQAVPIPGLPTTDTKTTGHQVTGTFSRELNKDLAAGLAAVYAVREERTAIERTDFSRWSLSVFANYVVPETIVVRGSIGVAQLEGGTADGSPLLITNSDLSYFLGPAVLGIRLERGFSETFGQGQNFGVVETTGISGSVTYRFTPLLSALLTGGYRETKFTGEGSGQAGGDDKTISASANMSYQVFRWLSASLTYSYTDTRSSESTASFVENRVHASLNALFY